jgi:hypothetical protein
VKIWGLEFYQCKKLGFRIINVKKKLEFRLINVKNKKKFRLINVKKLGFRIINVKNWDLEIYQCKKIGI